MAEKKLESLSEVIVKYSRRPVYILIATMLVSLTAITILAVLYGISMNPRTKYLLIIDGGLSTCTFSLFEYADWYGRSNAWIRERSHYTISSGTFLFGDDPTADAEAILQESKAVIAREVPLGLQRDTPVFFGAAAGFRMLRKKNPEKAQRLMVAVKNALADLAPEGVVLSMTKDVRVVSGAMQGFYAWFAANYLMGNFGKEYSEFQYRPLLTLGALNLDDVSTQMTFVPLAEEALPKSRMKVMAFGHSYNLYSQSHLCYGVVTIRARYLARLIQGSDLQKPVESPCHQSGLSMEVVSDDIFQAPCIISTEEDIMGPSIPKPSGAPAKIAFRGDYNAARCGQAIESIFADGPFANVYRPRLRGDFAAIDKLREVVTSFKKANHSAKVTRTEFVTAIDNFCASNWTTLPPEEQATSEEKCLQGWIAKGLLEAYGFKNDSDWSTIVFLGNVGGTVATWSTGYALEVTARIPSTAPAIRLNILGFIVGIAIFLNTFLMSLFLLIAKCCKRQW